MVREGCLGKAVFLLYLQIMGKLFKVMAVTIALGVTVASRADGTSGQWVPVTGPDGRLCVEVGIIDARPVYRVSYDGKSMLQTSPLGFSADIGDFTRVSAMTAEGPSPISRSYSLRSIKRSSVEYRANELRCSFEAAAVTEKGRPRHFTVVMRVSDNDLAFRYEIPREGQRGGIHVLSEATGFALPGHTTSFLCPQSDAQIGWKRTKPSYEEEYTADAPLDAPSRYGHGYTFPCLWRIGEEGWLLVSETGVDGRYCASHLSDPRDGLYTIAFPMDDENNGTGDSGAVFALPGHTPWRTVTVGSDLASIVETTVAWDVVEPRYESSHSYSYGAGSWSWILWGDRSINYEDQLQYVDLAAAMGWGSFLVDNYWDRNIGRERMAELSAYARSKGVAPILWYNSAGWWNDTDQSPLNRMDNPVERKKEMRWLQSIGAKGIKVDFFGGDKQETMRLYEAILSDADDYGLEVIFHGCTLPRGWEMMYPNYVGSEAVLASENLTFQEHFCEQEAFNATLHPFIRNTVAGMEFGGCFLNTHYRRDNSSGHPRHTSDVFQLATAVLFQNPVQNFALAPNNLTEARAEWLEFLRDVPTTWDETRYIDGYPGRYAVLARRHGDRWYIAGVNATGAPLSLNLALPVSGRCTIYEDGESPRVVRRRIRGGRAGVTMPADGGFVIIANN